MLTHTNIYSESSILLTAQNYIIKALYGSENSSYSSDLLIHCIPLKLKMCNPLEKYVAFYLL